LSMKIKQLKKLIDGLSDDTEILTSGRDHSYREPHIEVISALEERGGTWTEDYGEEVTPEAEYGKRKIVLFVG